MTDEELEAETRKVYALYQDWQSHVFAFQKHLMLWIKMIGAERTKKALSHAVDIFEAALKKRTS